MRRSSISWRSPRIGDTAQRWAGDLAKLPTVRNVITVDSIVPQEQPEKLALLEDIDVLLGPDFAELTRTAPPDARALRGALQQLERNLAGRSAASEQALRGAAADFLAYAEALPAASQEQAFLNSIGS